MHIDDLFEGAAYLQGPEIARHVSRAHHCTGKVQFANPAIAHRVAERTGREVYRCRTCGFFHVGGASPTISHKTRQASNLVRAEA